jgi:hypothetical protein
MRKLIFYAAAISAIAAALMGLVALAALPPLPPERLQEMSSLIVTGKATRVYTFVDDSSPDELYTYGVVELKVEKVEKGKYDSPLVYARYLQRGFRGRKAGWTGDGGHRGIPEVGEMTRAYLRMNKDGGYTALNPNGFNKLTSDSKKK